MQVIFSVFADPHQNDTICIQTVVSDTRRHYKQNNCNASLNHVLHHQHQSQRQYKPNQQSHAPKKCYQLPDWNKIGRHEPLRFARRKDSNGSLASKSLSQQE